MIRKLCKKIKSQTDQLETQAAQLAKAQRQNTQLLEIHSSISQTQTDIGLLLTDRQQSEGEREIITEVRALLDKNDAAMRELVAETDQGAWKLSLTLHSKGTLIRNSDPNF